MTVSEAYLGAEIDVPTIHGPVRARIPPGTAGGQRFRLKGYGVRSGRGADGDHYLPRLDRDAGAAHGGGPRARREVRRALRAGPAREPSARDSDVGGGAGLL